MEGASLQSWGRADLHLHTRFSGWRSLRVVGAQDCYVEPSVAYRTARARGMDFVCFTDHDTIDGARSFLDAHPDEEPWVIVGEEVEARLPDGAGWIHVNVFDVDERLHAEIVRLRPNAFELVAELAARGRLFALNHPFQSFRSIRSAERWLAALVPLFPAIEQCNSTSPRSHRRIVESLVRRCAPAPGPVRIGGSDAHTPSRIARVFTTAPGASKHEFLDSIRRGTCAIGGAVPGLGALVADVYRVVGRHYLSLCQRRDRPRRAIHVVASAALLPATLLGAPALVTALSAARQEWIARFGPWSSRAVDLRSRAAGGAGA
jgi:predicted metal-dependent phosphoesterase TrpH